MQSENKASGWTKIEGDVLKNQLENYHTLGITKSSRGQVVLVFGALLLLSLILSQFGFISISDWLISLILYIPLLIFVYKGHRWAMIGLMILWTIEKLYSAYLSIEMGGSLIGSVIWLVIGLSIINKALNVEDARRKLVPASQAGDKVSYCKECGTKQEKESKFCSNCGVSSSNK